MKMRPAVFVVLRFLRYQPYCYHLISRHTSFTFLLLCKDTSNPRHLQANIGEIADLNYKNRGSMV